MHSKLESSLVQKRTLATHSLPVLKLGLIIKVPTKLGLAIGRAAFTD